MEVAVTGGSGYIGSKLVPALLNEGHSIRVIDRVSFDLNWCHVDTPLCKVLVGDIIDQSFLSKAIEGIEAVIHLAAIVPRGEALTEVEKDLLWRVNYKAVINVVNLCKELRIKRFIFPSTCGVYGFRENGKLASEDDPVEVTSLYTESKIEAERFILGSAQQDFHPVILRFASVFGPAPRVSIAPLFNSLLYEAVVRKSIVLYDAEASRPFIHIDDVAKAISLALTAPLEKISGQILNVGADFLNLRKIDLAEVIKKYIPELDLVVKTYSSKRNYAISTDKIWRVIGFLASKGLEDGILEMINFFENVLTTELRDVK